MILIPAAGDGVRFKSAGYKGPKHLLPLNGRPMVDWVVDNVRPLDPDGQVVIADKAKVGKTKGAVETIHKALMKYGVESGPLVIANCDQLITLPGLELDEPATLGPEHDGVIYTFKSAEPAHSYVQTTRDRIFWIEEKKVVSDRAVAGVYWFKDVMQVLTACYEVLNTEQEHWDARSQTAWRPEDLKLNELYFSSAIRQMILQGAQLYAVDVPTAILGTPEDFQRFEVALSCAS